MFDSSQTRAAYDSAAAGHDPVLQRDRWMRRALWRHFARAFREGDHVLDVGCGTGIDTIHLASRGLRVTALDVSPRMLAHLRAKLDVLSLSSSVDLHAGDATDVIRGLAGPFDGVVSSFAALNSVALANFAAVLAPLLRPRARAIFHMLSPRSLGMNWRQKSGGRGPPCDTVSVTIGSARPLTLLALPPREVYVRYFAEAFLLRRDYPLGFLVRRSMETVVPVRVLDVLGRVECGLGKVAPLPSMGRFFVLDLERRTT